MSFIVLLFYWHQETNVTNGMSYEPSRVTFYNGSKPNCTMYSYMSVNLSRERVIYRDVLCTVFLYKWESERESDLIYRQLHNGNESKNTKSTSIVARETKNCHKSHSDSFWVFLSLRWWWWCASRSPNKDLPYMYIHMYIYTLCFHSYRMYNNMSVCIFDEN